MATTASSPPPATVFAAIVGTGFGGIGMAIQLKQSGIDDFVMLERSDRIGGTWRDNVYPGAACDVPSLLYSFSFEPDYPWPRFYARQPDILRYEQHCIDTYGLAAHVRLGFGVVRAVFDEAGGHWIVSAADGRTLHARILKPPAGGAIRPTY